MLYHCLAKKMFSYMTMILSSTLSLNKDKKNDDNTKTTPLKTETINGKIRHADGINNQKKQSYALI